MRPLVMDFRQDRNILDIADEYMFGPSMLVCPVTEPGAESRKVYLPEGTGWVDFWTGKALEGGQVISAAAGRDRMPLFVRAGSIVIMGSDVQYAGEKAADPLEVRVYGGADGACTLYEDEGDNYNYEQGSYSTIVFNWDDGQKQLTVGARAGAFPGMLEKRTFRIVLVKEGHGNGIAPAAADKETCYTGEALNISLR